MKKQDILTFLRLIPTDKIRVGDEWITATCPLASARHKGGVDSEPSFGVKINEEGPSNYNCFGCGSGSLSHLLHVLMWTTGVRQEAIDFLILNECFNGVDHHEGNIFVDCYAGEDKAEHLVPIPVPDFILERYPLLENQNTSEAKRCQYWLRSRGVDGADIHRYAIRYDPDGPFVMFPFIDLDGKVYKLHRCWINSKRFSYEKGEWGKKDIWYGMQFYSTAYPVCLVESETDLHSLRKYGMTRVLASCGSVSKEQLSRIASDTVILGYDSDEAGKRYCLKTIEELPTVTLFVRLHWDRIGLKDAGDLTAVEQWQAVWNARSLIMKGGDGVFRPMQLAEYKERYGGK